MTLFAQQKMCTAREWCDRIDVGWVLGNTLSSYIDGMPDTADVETCWGNPRTTKQMIDSVAAAGFNALRLSVRWYPHFTDSINAVVDTTWLARIKEIADWGLDDGMQVMINTDHEEWLELQPYYADSASVLHKERNLWRQLAMYFRDYDDRLVFAGTGEPHAGEFFSKPTEENLFMQNHMNQVFVDAVRSTGGRNLQRNLLVQTYQSDPRLAPEAFVKPKDVSDGHLIVEIHYYYPFQYTVADFGIKYYGDKYKLYGSTVEDPELDATMQKMKEMFSDKNLPVVIAETGASQWYNEGDENWKQMRQSRAEYYYYTISAARKYNIPCFVFDDGLTGKGTMYFSFFDRHNNMRVVNPVELGSILKAAKRE